jgi:hypothetical protein
MLSSILRSKLVRIGAMVVLAFIAIRAVESVFASAAGHSTPTAGNGTPIKLSVLDHGVDVPSILVTTDGTIHVLYAEQQTQSPYQPFLYYRCSRDGGKSWTAPKNLSEVLPETPVGTTKLLADNSGRVYAIWRTSFNIVINGSQPASQGDGYNLFYRVLENGAWSKAIPIHPPTTMQQQHFGSASWFAVIDPSAGKPQVFWNTNPAPRHPESYVYGFVAPGIKLGSVMRVVLDGANATQPEEIFHTPITSNGPNQPTCEGLDMLNGYVDKAGQPHILAQVEKWGANEQTNRFQLIENNTQYAAVELPGPSFTYWGYPPTLLVDEQGRRHVVTMYPYGETQSVRDYTLGSNAEPVVVRAATAGTGKVMGVQAFQGPSGRMAALIQMADKNEQEDAETYLVTNDGNHWNAPRNLTNNVGRSTFQYTATGARSNVATASHWYPGNGAAAFDASGHLYVAYIVNRNDVFQQSGYGVTLAGGSSSVPQLLFARF